MKANERLFLDVHILQTVPPSCVNRDDTGSPKSAIYGGANRARVSSQSWKKAMRGMFEELMPQDSLGKRTKRIVSMVEKEIQKLGGIENAEEAAINILTAAGLKIKSAEKGTDALFFMSAAQAKALAKVAVEDPDTIKSTPSAEAKKKAKQALIESPGVDIALFGRMVADEPSLNTDACAQVAHSISTHKVSREYDYFTAVDDLSPEDNTGAGHIGTVEFNSSTLYQLRHCCGARTASPPERRNGRSSKGIFICICVFHAHGQAKHFCQPYLARCCIGDAAERPTH